jgi:hypothetical protein
MSSGFDSVASLAILLLAAIIHASFQLSVSVLTLLSGHALGRKTAHRRVTRLIGSFTLGAGAMTVLLLSTLAYGLSLVMPSYTPEAIWALCSGAVIGVGVSVWLFYYRRAKGTTLWITRGFAEFLNDRTSATKIAPEAFALGLTSIFAELLFVFAPLLVAALVLIRLDPTTQLLGVLAYSGISLLPLLVVSLLISGGKRLSRIQKWRESNKRFLQFAAGSGLVILGVYIYVEQVITVNVIAMGLQ